MSLSRATRPTAKAKVRAWVMEVMEAKEATKGAAAAKEAKEAKEAAKEVKEAAKEVKEATEAVKVAKEATEAAKVVKVVAVAAKVAMDVSIFRLDDDPCALIYDLSQTAMVGPVVESTIVLTESEMGRGWKCRPNSREEAVRAERSMIETRRLSCVASLKIVLLWNTRQ